MISISLSSVCLGGNNQRFHLNVIIPSLFTPVLSFFLAANDKKWVKAKETTFWGNSNVIVIICIIFTAISKDGG